MAQPRRNELRIDPEDRVPISGEDRPSRNRDRQQPDDDDDPLPPPRRGGGREGSGRPRRGAATRKSASPPRRGGRRRLGWILFRWAMVAAIWGAVVLAGIFAYFSLTLPDTRDLMTATRKPSVTLLAADGSLIATFGDLFGEPLKLREMSPWVPQAVLATEDRRFYSHFGVDVVGLTRAAVVNFRAGRVVQGGSTLTQQLAKNLFLTPERTTTRKIQEALLALWLERKFTKDQILEIYLNRVYFGSGAYGVDAAARRYFGKSGRELNVYEAAVIAGLLKAPSRFSPARDRDRAAQRAEQVLANMVDAGYLTAAQAATAQRQSTRLAAVAGTRPGTRYFADYLIEFIGDFGGAAKISDLLVRTTLDPRLQAAAEAAVAEMLQRDGPKAGVGQAALVAMSPDGAIRAMVGGRDYGESQFNRATQALRQPGSSFKPFVYLAALENGYAPNTRWSDAPVRIGNWQPHNYTRTYLGEVTMAEALAQSLNTVTVQVSERVGRSRVAATARRLGISSDLTPDASIALGTSEATLVEMTGAYAAFASGGLGAWPYGVVEIKDNRGNVLFRRSGAGPGRVISEQVAGQMNEMLSGVIGRGTGRSAALDRPAAGKTGTTQDYRDAWFIGYTADLVAGVWLGNDDNTPMKRVTGGTLPAKTWRSFMLAATGGHPVRPLPAAPSPGWFSLDGLFSAVSRQADPPAQSSASAAAAASRSSSSWSLPSWSGGQSGATPYNSGGGN
jgi:penicillin-binding protein 1A